LSFRFSELSGWITPRNRPANEMVPQTTQFIANAQSKNHAFMDGLLATFRRKIALFGAGRDRRQKANPAKLGFAGLREWTRPTI
jgi:hypothetical protein